MRLTNIVYKADALGFKILVGHHPLTPETTTAAIEVANAAGAYVAFHCGTTRNGSNGPNARPAG